MNTKGKQNLGAASKRAGKAPVVLRKGYVHPVSLDQAAELLGRTKSHLRKVLTGERQSPALLKAYTSLVGGAV